MARVAAVVLAVRELDTTAEISDSAAYTVFRRTRGTTELRFLDEATGDGAERSDEPGRIVRSDTAKQVEELDEHLAALAVREAQLVDVDALGLREGEHHRANHVIRIEHRTLVVRLTRWIGDRDVVPDF